MLSGCVIYFDSPPERTISGHALNAETGEPLKKTIVTFSSGRKPFSLLPVDTFGIEASTTTDENGFFTITTRLKDPASAEVLRGNHYQLFPLPHFPESNRLDNMLFKVSKYHCDEICPENKAR